jgi:hypothetical protein
MDRIGAADAEQAERQQRRKHRKTDADDRTFDVVIATYGRIRFVAEALAGKTPCFIAIGGL